jgi:hypothetical protein
MPVQQNGGDIQYFLERGQTLNQTGLTPIFNFPHQQFQMHHIGDILNPIIGLNTNNWLTQNHVIFLGIVGLVIIGFYYVLKHSK